MIFQENRVMKYHALFVIFLKSDKIGNCRLLQIVGGAVWVKNVILEQSKREKLIKFLDHLLYYQKLKMSVCIQTEDFCAPNQCIDCVCCKNPIPWRDSKTYISHRNTVSLIIFDFLQNRRCLNNHWGLAIDRISS